LSLIAGKAYDNSVFPEITFIHQESLNEEMWNFLRDMHIPESELKFILDAPRCNATISRPNDDWNAIWTKQLLDEYSLKEKRLLEIFPEYA
jgi:hypothetical protein